MTGARKQAGSDVTTVTFGQSYLPLWEVYGYAGTSDRDRWRFIDKVRVDSSGCFLWTAGTNTGYGQYYYQGRPQKAHRVAWLLSRGPIPDGLNVLHRCDVTACVNPEHLFLGTQYDNVGDMVRKGRMRVGVGERHGNARLTDNRVRAIRLLLSEGIRPAAIARCLGVSIQTIGRIRDGRAWRHVDAESQEAVA